MPLCRDSQQRKAKSFNCAYARSITLVILLFVGSAPHLPAQLPKSATPPANAEPAAPIDPLGRETPRGAVMGLLKYGELRDFATAARYLQPPPPGQDANLAQRAEQLVALNPRLKANVGLLSDDPKGTVDAGLPPGEERVGVWGIDGTTRDFILVRVDDPDSGKIWLVSKETVASIPALYAQMESEAPTIADRVTRATRTGRQLLGMSIGQWLGWLLSIPLSWLLAWLLTFLLSVPRRVWCKLQKLPIKTVWDTPLGLPLRCVIAIVLHGFFVFLLYVPLLYRVYYIRFLAALLVGCLAWLVSRLSDKGFDRVVSRTRTQRAGGESILILMQRLTHITMAIVAFVAALALFGLNVKTTLTGLGIGGLAIALAAQKSLENLIGGVSLLMDKAVHVGDFCEIGGQLGTVEDIGLRSLKLRTLDQNLLVVPNGSLAQMQFQNMKARPKLLLNQNFSLRIETQAEQLRFVLNRVQNMLDKHPAIESETSRVRVAAFAGAAFQLELFAYGKTGDWTEFTAIRQDVILKIAEIVEAAGTRFAAPTQLTYLSRAGAVDAEKSNDIVHRVTTLDRRYVPVPRQNPNSNEE